MVFPNLWTSIDSTVRERKKAAQSQKIQNKIFLPSSIRKPQKLQKTKEKCDFTPRNFLNFSLALVSGGCYESLEFLLIFVMKPNTTDGVGLLAEVDKPTKTPWFLRFAGAVLQKIGSARTGGGVDKDGLLAKTAKGIVSFVPNILPSQTPKEGVHPVPKAFRLRQHGLGILCAGFLVAFIAMPNAQAQLPDYHYAGTDIYIKYKRASINPFEPYFPIEAELHVINHPTNSVEGRVVKNRFVAPPAGYNGRRCTLSYNECPRDHFVFSTSKTTWNRDNTFSNGESYQRYCQRWGRPSDHTGTCDDHKDYHHDAIY